MYQNNTLIEYKQSQVNLVLTWGMEGEEMKTSSWEGPKLRLPTTFCKNMQSSGPHIQGK